ncbi:MAG: TetR/AcrR family transcriptional regulator [Phycisphaerales bacterium]
MTRLPASKRREQLLDCAAELFAKYGYARATTAQLAKAAGVTEPIIYRHFDSKRDLFVALIERTGRETIDFWERHLADAAESTERLRRLLGDNPMVTERGRFAYRVILQAISETEDPVIHDALRNHIKSLHAFLTEELEAAQKEHKVTSRFSAELLAWLLIHIALGYGVLDAMAIPGQGEDQQGVTVRELIARMLVGPKSDNKD